MKTHLCFRGNCNVTHDQRCDGVVASWCMLAKKEIHVNVLGHNPLDIDGGRFQEWNLCCEQCVHLTKQIAANARSTAGQKSSSCMVWCCDAEWSGVSFEVGSGYMMCAVGPVSAPPFRRTKTARKRCTTVHKMRCMMYHARIRCTTPRSTPTPSHKHTHTHTHC